MQAIEHPPDLEKLFRDSAADLARFFSRRHGGAEKAQDLVQETFLHMARSLKSGKRPRHLRSYLFGVARHVSSAAWREKSKDANLRASLATEETVAAASGVNDERLGAAREVMGTLSPLHREILDLRFQQGMNYAEIAETMEIPVGTVRSRLHYAIARIRETLSDNE